MRIIFSSDKKDKFEFQNMHFENPINIISCFKLTDVINTFNNLDEALNNGYYLAGFISYECGYAFEEAFFNDKIYDFPLIWFGVFKNYKKEARGKASPRGYSARGGQGARRREINAKNLKLNISKQKYHKAIENIKTLISKGDIYQVNFTMKYKFNFNGNPFEFYNELKNKQLVSYSAFIDDKDFKIISLSPELFFAKRGSKIFVKPMKGTIKRGKNIEEDEELLDFLKKDKKNKAENIMIVDLMRNDLGKIAAAGNVFTESLFDVERFETLFQMTSSVNAEIDKNISLYRLFTSIFPSGSVTGAPKVHTMEVINKLEKEERKIYTGAIGYIFPDRNMVFNVAIRTILLRGGKAEMGIGSGIVYDSEQEKELDECKIKADFLTKKLPQFDLVETILWQDLKYGRNGKKNLFLLNDHLFRMQKSADYFNFKFNIKKILGLLKKAQNKFNPSKKYKVRILLSKDGTIEISHTEINQDYSDKGQKIIFSKIRTSSGNIFLHHKTTNRDLYNNEYKKYSEKWYFDVIFMNEKDEITEGAVSNIFIKNNNKFYTPPLKCGLLDGLFRKYFMSKKNVCEKIIYEKDLQNADEIFLCNSVKGLVKVSLD